MTWLRRRPGCSRPPQCESATGGPQPDQRIARITAASVAMTKSQPITMVRNVRRPIWARLARPDGGGGRRLTGKPAPRRNLHSDMSRRPASPVGVRSEPYGHAWPTRSCNATARKPLRLGTCASSFATRPRQAPSRAADQICKDKGLMIDAEQELSIERAVFRGIIVSRPRRILARIQRMHRNT